MRKKLIVINQTPKKNPWLRVALLRGLIGDTLKLGTQLLESRSLSLVSFLLKFLFVAMITGSLYGNCCAINFFSFFN